MLKNKINGKIYIGQTIRPIQKRFDKHQHKSSRCRAIYNAILKYGWGNFEKDWYECPDEDLNFDEELLVREMGTLSPDGYNLKEGGGSRGKYSEETKQKMSESNRGEKNIWYGKTHTEETKQKMREAQRGEKHPMYGKTVSEQTKQKLSEARRGEKNHMYGKTGEKNHCSKKIYQHDLEGNLLGSFGSIWEASRHLNIKDSSNITKCARGKLKTAYGFKWSYDPPST